MEFISADLQAYVEAHSDEESALLANLNRDTYTKVMLPRMLSGQLQGRMLSMLSQMIQPKRILEIGTYTGYSAICMAEGMQEDGKLITLDINEELEVMVRGYFEKAGLTQRLITALVMLWN